MKEENDNKIKLLMNKVADKKSKLGSRPKVSWNTNGVYKFSGGHVNLNVVKDVDQIIGYVSNLLQIRDYATKAAIALSIKAREPLYEGYLVSDWIEDFKKRIEVIEWEAEQLKIQALEKKLADLISEEAKTQMELEAIEKEI
jgi:hypothetical protein